MKKPTFGAGCFWHVEKEFRKVNGISKTAVGYMGGDFDSPSYEDVRTGKTGHAEVCEIEYNPNKASYEELLKIFWKIHDPTQLNKQGLDTGTQYRSVIFYHDEEQKTKATELRKQEQKNYKNKIVTEIVPVKKFWMAEEYHQGYLKKKGIRIC